MPSTQKNKFIVFNTETNEPWSESNENYTNPQFGHQINENEPETIPLVFDDLKEALLEIFDYASSVDDAVRNQHSLPDVLPPKGYTTETAPYTLLRSHDELKDWISKTPDWRNQIITSIVPENLEIRTDDLENAEVILTGNELLAKAIETTLENGAQSKKSA